MKKVNFIISFLFVSLMLFSCNNTDEVAPLPASSAGQYTVADFEGSWNTIKAAQDGDTVLATSPNKCDLLKAGFGNLIVDLSIQYMEWSFFYDCANSQQSLLWMIIDNQNVISVVSAGRTIAKYKILETTDITSNPKRLDIICIEDNIGGIDILGMTFFFIQ